ncbi:lipoprotein [Solibacillus sp. CAU 1738]|uniref:lipoprotein n=1 Tax=Solibacillus sp. CAU 1738 TaxID=3140363 RepID=UPI0032615EFB
MKKIIFFIVFTFILSSCNQLNKESNEVEVLHSDENISTVLNMPHDFGFIIQFGVGKKNEINTFENTVTKDLISDGTATANVALTDKELNNIYEKMKEINIEESKNFIPKPINGSICVMEPHEEDEWEITINGETITHSISGAYCDPTKDAQQLIELRNYVFNIIKSKEEYLVLPASNGSYE